MKQEDATKLLIQLIKKGNHGMYGKYGYDIHLPNLIRSHLEQSKNRDSLDPMISTENRLKEMMPYFYDAAWELCRRGIIRPGVKEHQAQATEDGSAGNGYSITFFGKQWLNEENDDFVPTEPERFAQMLEPYKKKYGLGFHQRSQEAIKCYGAHSYLACCVMCGAAAESIFLAIAIEGKDEEKVMKIYYRSNGRSQVEKMLLGQSTKSLQEEFKGYNGLLKYWRDEASHGNVSKIDENEAYTSLALLLRFAKFVNDRWDDLKSKP